MMRLIRTRDPLFSIIRLNFNISGHQIRYVTNSGSISACFQRITDLMSETFTNPLISHQIRSAVSASDAQCEIFRYFGTL